MQGRRMRLKDSFQSSSSPGQVHAARPPVPIAGLALHQAFLLEAVQHGGQGVRVRVSAPRQIFLSEVILLRQRRQNDVLIGSNTALAEVRLGPPVKA